MAITDRYWQELLDGQSQGKHITSDADGNPILEDYPEPTTDELAITMRAKRDQILSTVVDSMNAIRWETLTEGQKESWRIYRKALLDVPEQEGFPTDITWPELNGADV